jgi:hypothetical protein
VNSELFRVHQLANRKPRCKLWSGKLVEAVVDVRLHLCELAEAVKPVDHFILLIIPFWNWKKVIAIIQSRSGALSGHPKLCHGCCAPELGCAVAAAYKNWRLGNRL